MSRVRLEGIWRRFGSTVALDAADLTAHPGEVHAVLGENGAGKTTLLSVLAGELSADRGQIRIDDRSVRFESPREAWAGGVGMVHQHFALVPRLTVLENLLLGGSEFALNPLPADAVRARALEVAASAGLTIDPDRAVETLSVGEQQRVEILKVLLRDPAVLILDEPTAVLSPPEVGPLLGLLRAQAALGRTVLIVAHKLDEVLSVADRVTVLRHGRTVLEAGRSDVDAETLSRAMVGESLPADLVRISQSRGAGEAQGVGEARRTANLQGGNEDQNERGVGAPSGAPSGPVEVRSESPVGMDVAVLSGVASAPLRGTGLQGISLSVQRGEIVGIAGVEGNGQRDLARILAGIDSPTAGRVELPAGVGYVPQDRRAEGLVESFSLVENLALAWADDPEFRVGPFIRWGTLRERAARELERFDVRSSGPDALASTLSGGNQQRVVLAREFARARDLLVAENPTRGLDVAGTAWVRRALRDLADHVSSDADGVRGGHRAGHGAGHGAGHRAGNGVGHATTAAKGGPTSGPGIILISTDLDEILSLSDRIFVLLRGDLRAFEGVRPTRREIGRLMVGSDQ